MRINTVQCAAFYKHFVLEGDNVLPCCKWNRPIQKFEGDFSQVLNSKKFVKLRKKAEAGQKLKECSKCYYEEELEEVYLFDRYLTHSGALMLSK